MSESEFTITGKKKDKPGSASDLGCALVFLLLHVIAAEMDPFELALSEYVLTAAGRWYTGAIAFLVLAVASLAVALHAADPRVSAGGLTPLGVFIVAMMMAGIFPTDAIDPRATNFTLSQSGVIHASAMRWKSPRSNSTGSPAIEAADATPRRTHSPMGPAATTRFVPLEPVTRNF